MSDHDSPTEDTTATRALRAAGIDPGALPIDEMAIERLLSRIEEQLRALRAATVTADRPWT